MVEEAAASPGGRAGGAGGPTATRGEVGPPRDRLRPESRSLRCRLCITGPRPTGAAPAKAVGPAPWATDRRWRGLAAGAGRFPDSPRGTPRPPNPSSPRVWVRSGVVLPRMDSRGRKPVSRRIPPELPRGCPVSEFAVPTGVRWLSRPATLQSDGLAPQIHTCRPGKRTALFLHKPGWQGVSRDKNGALGSKLSPHPHQDVALQKPGEALPQRDCLRAPRGRFYFNL